MKKCIAVMLLASLLPAVSYADQSTPGKREKGRPHRMSPPVYASQQTDGKFNRHGKVEDMSPEQRAKFNAARQRRFEIMVLIGAYKIMPEAERKALRSELLKRIDADFQATVNDQKDRIVRAENDLKKLRAELAERESHRSELVERELERLLKMPMPGGRGRTGSRSPEKNTK